GARRYRSAEELVVHLVEGGIFKDRPCGNVALYIELGPERQRHAFLAGHLQQTAFGRGVISSNLVGASEGRDGARIVMALGIDVGPGKLIVVALLVFRRIAQRGQLLLRLAIVALSNVGIS